MNKVICTLAFVCPEKFCRHAAPHEAVPACQSECPEYPNARCATPLFYLTEADLGDRIGEVNSREPHLPSILTADEFQSVAEDVYQQLTNVWSEEMDEVIVEALEFIQYGREEE